jgi:phospholipase D3/4
MQILGLLHDYPCCRAAQCSNLTAYIFVFYQRIQTMFALLTSLAAASACIEGADCGTTAFLAESLPADIDLPLVEGAQNTWTAQVALIKGATHTLDVTAMYWNLLAQNDQYSDYTPAEFAAFGASQGRAVYDAFADAIGRGVRVRFLNGAGIGSSNASEVADLVALARSPGQVQALTWDAADWYGGGIMHQKVWIADGAQGGASVYLGSANMDWLSLSQVKELGIVVQRAPRLAADMTKLFQRWWLWADPATPMPADPPNVTAFDPTFGVNRSVPCWSALLDCGGGGGADNKAAAARCASPLDAAELVSAYGERHPLHSAINGAPARSYVSGSPVELLEGGVGDGGGAGPGRTWDQDALVSTIMGAERSVSLSVMDFIPSSLYTPPAAPLWWGALANALLTAATAKGVQVRLLVSKWAHTNARIAPFLAALKAMGAAAHADAGSYAPQCKGSLAVKLFVMPGWNETRSDPPVNGKYPPYSRVNHAKYIVTDQRVNVGTSNMAWGCKSSRACSSPPLRDRVLTC